MISIGLSFPTLSLFTHHPKHNLASSPSYETKKNTWNKRHEFESSKKPRPSSSPNLTVSTKILPCTYCHRFILILERENKMDSTSGGGGEGPSPSAAAAADGGGSTPAVAPPSRYESQKRRDWNTFLQYLKNHKPPLTLARCSGAHVIEFLKYLDQFGKTKVHVTGCPYFGHPNPPALCACPLKQAWGSLDALIGRLRAAYEENGGRPESNPFGARAVRIYLREVRESQAKARGIPYEKKKRKRPTTVTAVATVGAVSSTTEVGNGGGTSGGGGGNVSVSISAPPTSTV